MGRIRTVKPDFFRDEDLQDLEAKNPGAYVMLVFEGLWTISDKFGHFEWKPRVMKLDILPFLEFEMETTLALLREAEFISQYEVGGQKYGEVTNFSKHQRINGKEAQEPEKFPVYSQGSTGEAIGKQLRSQERKGKEEESIVSTASPKEPAFNSTEVALILGKEEGWSGIWLTHAFRESIEWLASTRNSTDYIALGGELTAAWKAYELKQGKFAGGVQKFFQEGKYKTYVTKAAAKSPKYVDLKAIDDEKEQWNKEGEKWAREREEKSRKEKANAAVAD